ncbi:fatty acid elongase [Echria macrotheca]|uniref:Elongation of fatty acids protein n=1 Tax=Echria macrotheca TaxID=438768 RepID=A0AAJ0B9K8_9PEZI|nr:fatty acid elongase [Echria macrotheca]
MAVSFALPSSALFKFPPNTNPAFLSPPPVGSSAFAPPVHIPDNIYNAVLDPKVPITIAALYAVTAKALNAYNKSTGKKPWGISKTATFRWFVIAHNVFLAVYSAWTFVGMFGALRRTMVNPLGPTGLSGFVDSVCKLNGPAGLGNAAIFDEATNSWQSYGSESALDSSGMPSQFAMGRLWNEGLAFYGWIFYLSKFYEVLDTFIILAKGKFSSTLQTYHHAGAMMCMWAGIRYMSAPIWMFVFVNSGIHAMMYTYYTVTAFNIRVPIFIKRSLTTMQITQFLVGASYAMAHSFVSYSVPAPHNTATREAVASASAAAASNSSASAVLDSIKGDISYKTVSCIDTNSATFAVWLNVLYLTPLTYLFVSFFIESYLRRSNAADKKAAGKKNGAASRRLSNNLVAAEKAGWEAAKNVEREVYGESNEAVSNGKTNGRVLRTRQA